MRRDDTVTASEIGDFVFCPKAWRLARLGAQPTQAIQAARVEGERHHASLGVAEASATRSIKRGRGLVAAGILTLVVIFALWLATR